MDRGRNDESEAAILDRARAHALAFLDSLETRRIAPAATPAELRARFAEALPEQSSDPGAVIDALARDAEDGLLGSASGRFFGWVIGGTLPVAIAAEWLTAAWDQNCAAYALSPAEAVVEEVCGAWLKQLLGLPETASFAFVTGCQMAHVTALAAARHALLERHGIDVERTGLAGAPPIRVLLSENRHETLLRAVRLLGMGTDSITPIACEPGGAMRMDALADALREHAQGPLILCLQAGDLNTGSYDAFAPACEMAHAHGAWVHVDGAFGLWAAVSPRLHHLLRGVGQADSWATDGHKWLNLPQDIGFAFVADRAAHHASFGQATAYGVLVEDTRRQINWNPEWSRRARGFPVYAAIRALGRAGITEIVERCCDRATALVEGMAAMPGVEVLARPIINPGLVRFLADDGNHDARTEAVIRRVQESGTAWFGPTTWHGMRAMRISVCNWRTSEEDVRRTLKAIREAMRS